MEKQAIQDNQYRSLAEKVIESPALKKGLKGISGFVKNFALSFDDVVSSAYRAPTNIRRFLNKQNYLLRNKGFIAEDPQIGAIFGFSCGVVPCYFIGAFGLIGVAPEFMDDLSFIFAGTNLISLIYETGRFRQSKKERQTVLNQIQKTKEEAIEKGRYSSYTIEKINKGIPKPSLYLINESNHNWKPSSPNAREIIIDNSGEIYSERRYWLTNQKKPKKKRVRRK